ncbi:hypothetical protein ACGFNU_44900 [Spirillospora sp. NPDC048911]|uniref:hypothetical protein n=1 Tax=Spirillospora sp. NPDC048911 TaxID=3364527 RepID=UPI0037163247
MRASGRALLTAVAAASLIVLNPTAAFAAYYGGETDYAVNWTPPDVDQHWTCKEITGAFACFTGKGDYLEVHDTKADGYAAAIDWDDVDSGRSGSCVSKLGSGSQGSCNKNFTEGHTIRIRASRYNAGNPVDHSAWVDANA